MKYFVLTPETEQKLAEIKRRIHRLQNWGSIVSLEHLGINPEKQVGASYLSLKTLAARYQPDENLAYALWNTQRREEQILACFLLPKKINKEKIIQLIPGCISEEVAEYMGSLFLSEHPELPEIIQKSKESAEPFFQIAALCAGARHLRLNKTNPLISPDLFKILINKEYENKYVRLVADRYR